MEHIFVGRQPILDRKGKLYGYELLHRATPGRPVGDGDAASSEMLLKTVWEIGIPQVSGAHRSFVNMTRNLLLSPGLDALPPAGIVLEILESVAVDDELLRRLTRLRKRRFEIALDDFEHSAERDPLIDLADIVKLDCLALDETGLARHVELLKRRNVRLLAEKVETREMHERTMALGFDYFQGYYFARPQLQRAQRVPTNKLVLLELLSRVSDPGVSVKELAAIVRGDVWISITVLRWANGSLHGLRYAVESVERAILVHGLQTIRNWVALLTMAKMGAAPGELLKMVLVRARACELIANEAKQGDSAKYFTVGLLSALDVILQIDMTRALELVPIAQDQREALLTHAGDLGTALQNVIELESGASCANRYRQLPEESLLRCYLSALAWADNLGRNGL